jgi:hypothetical protein
MAVVTRRGVDRVGGVGSILVGFFCAWMAYRDFVVQHSLWKVEALMAIVLIVNGLAMLRYASRSTAREQTPEVTHS